ncbi:hypothetical protein PBCVCVR1_996R [Paramecium bursaria Chlorella virus CVR-1]|uniref:Uncharacterized protein n=1 Tax=Paramecium bursaria Chlorella virus CVA-1 TaxID=42683 RepID=M1GYG7_9PHYC|nr:hypothetical protein F8205_gp137 [Paramecium bursaria Chlorella virus CVA-1]AGE50688.1 hypothetical protein PBCVCVA1_991R [Paramecium bursaria Chlorella virus CVA-1]AGE52365.1 hypothetical protein PBCVCVR1_996R [Paramecium bursaria Chlorella virus CVR-1]
MTDQPVVLFCTTDTTEDITKSDKTPPHALYNIDITLAHVNNGKGMWSLAKGGKADHKKIEPGLVIFLGRGSEGGYKYRATVVSTEVKDFPDVPVPDWYNKDKYKYPFIITDLRRLKVPIKPAEFNEFKTHFTRAYTWVTGNPAQNFLTRPYEVIF